MTELKLEVLETDCHQWKILVGAFMKSLENVLKKTNAQTMRSFCTSKQGKEIMGKFAPQFHSVIKDYCKHEFAKLCHENDVRQKLNKVYSGGQRGEVEEFVFQMH